jgi:hypothetical protein
MSSSRPSATVSLRLRLARPGAALAAVLITMLGVMASPALAQSPRSAHGPTVNASTPCVGLSGGPARIKHVIVPFMENQPYDAVIGSPQAPYVNDLASRCGLATNSHNITHRSAPEYIAATSGELGGIDCPPVFLDPSWPPTCPDMNDNIFHQAMAAGETWKNYEESMATNWFDRPVPHLGRGRGRQQRRLRVQHQRHRLPRRDDRRKPLHPTGHPVSETVQPLLPAQDQRGTNQTPAARPRGRLQRSSQWRPHSTSSDNHRRPVAPPQQVASPAVRRGPGSCGDRRPRPACDRDGTPTSGSPACIAHPHAYVP